MPAVSSEITSDITEHIRKAGGGFADWRIGTARDWHCPVLEAHRAEEKDDALICREAYTPAAARAVRDHFVHECGLAPSKDEGSQDGKLVYVYRTLPEHTKADISSSQNASPAPR